MISKSCWGKLVILDIMAAKCGKVSLALKIWLLTYLAVFAFPLSFSILNSFGASCLLESCLQYPQHEAASGVLFGWNFLWGIFHAPLITTLGLIGFQPSMDGWSWWLLSAAWLVVVG